MEEVREAGEEHEEDLRDPDWRRSVVVGCDQSADKRNPCEDAEGCCRPGRGRAPMDTPLSDGDDAQTNKRDQSGNL